MADEMFMYAVTTGIFAFLVAVCFGARGARKRSGPGEEVEDSHSSGSSGGKGRRIKKFNSDACVRIGKIPRSKRLYCSHTTVLV